MSVTATERLCKQPSESRLYKMEFGKVLDLVNSEAISTITSITSAQRDGTATDLAISSSGIVSGLASGSSIQMSIASGTTGREYRIEILVTTTTSQILEGDGILLVTDR